MTYGEAFKRRWVICTGIWKTESSERCQESEERVEWEGKTWIGDEGKGNGNTRDDDGKSGGDLCV